MFDLTNSAFLLKQVSAAENNGNEAGSKRAYWKSSYLKRKLVFYISNYSEADGNDELAGELTGTN